MAYGIANVGLNGRRVNFIFGVYILTSFLVFMPSSVLYIGPFIKLNTRFSSILCMSSINTLRYGDSILGKCLTQLTISSKNFMDS